MPDAIAGLCLSLADGRNLDHRCAPSPNRSQPLHWINPAKVALSDIEASVPELALQRVQRHALPAHVHREAVSAHQRTACRWATPTGHEFPDVRGSHSERLRQRVSLLASREALADLAHRRIRESLVDLGVSVVRPSLERHVSLVVSHRPDEQVRGVDARRVVAVVADDEAIGDRSDVQLIRDAVSLEPSAPIATPDVPVAVLVAGALPLPTVVGVSGRDESPEPDVKGDGGLVGASFSQRCSFLIAVADEAVTVGAEGQSTGRAGCWLPFEAEAWPIIEHEPEHEPTVPPDLSSRGRA